MAGWQLLSEQSGHTTARCVVLEGSLAALPRKDMAAPRLRNYPVWHGKRYMTILIIIFGALTLLAGIVLVINPAIIFGFLQERLARPELHILAVVVRLVLGFLLIYESTVSKFPLAIEIIGWLSIVAAIVLGVMGRHNFKRLMSWALSFVNNVGRAGGVLAAAFGSFLIYAFV